METFKKFVRKAYSRIIKQNYDFENINNLLNDKDDNYIVSSKGIPFKITDSVKSINNLVVDKSDNYTNNVTLPTIFKIYELNGNTIEVNIPNQEIHLSYIPKLEIKNITAVMSKNNTVVTTQTEYTEQVYIFLDTQWVKMTNAGNNNWTIDTHKQITEVNPVTQTFQIMYLHS